MDGAWKLLAKSREVLGKAKGAVTDAVRAAAAAAGRGEEYLSGSGGIDDLDTSGGGGSTTTVSSPSPAPAVRVSGGSLRKLQAATAVGDGSVWFGFRSGALVRIDRFGARMQEVGLDAGVCCLCVVGLRLWVGMADGGIVVLGARNGRRLGLVIPGGSISSSSSGSGAAADSSSYSTSTTTVGQFVLSVAKNGEVSAWPSTLPSPPLESALHAALAAHSQAFTKRRKLQVATGTWNVGEEKPDGETVQAWLGEVARGADVVAVGLQEVEMGARAIALAAAKESVGMGLQEKESGAAQEWTAVIRKALGAAGSAAGGGSSAGSAGASAGGSSGLTVSSDPSSLSASSSSSSSAAACADDGFVRIASRQLAGMLLTVWVRESLLPDVSNVETGAVALMRRLQNLLSAFLPHPALPHRFFLSFRVRESLLPDISDVETGAVACGFGRALGNKGGVGVRMTICGRVCAIINCHLAAHDNATAKRNEDWHRIYTSMEFGRSMGTVGTAATNAAKAAGDEAGEGRGWEKGVRVYGEVGAGGIGIGFTQEWSLDDLWGLLPATLPRLLEVQRGTDGLVCWGGWVQGGLAWHCVYTSIEFGRSMGTGGTAATRAAKAAGAGFQSAVQGFVKAAGRGVGGAAGAAGFVPISSTQGTDVSGSDWPNAAAGINSSSSIGSVDSYAESDLLIWMGDLNYRLDGSDLLIWMGDLNYRLDGCSYDEACSAIARRQYPLLLECDQLRAEMKAGRAFVGMQEGKVDFAPTYKFDRGTFNPLGECFFCLLKGEMKAGREFVGMQEGVVDFTPTYKFDRGTFNPLGGCLFWFLLVFSLPSSQTPLIPPISIHPMPIVPPHPSQCMISAYDSGEKRRVPAWCDRILFRDSFTSSSGASQSGETSRIDSSGPIRDGSGGNTGVAKGRTSLSHPVSVEVLRYTSCMAAFQSDHKPVTSLMQVTVACPDAAAQRSLVTRLLASPLLSTPLSSTSTTSSATPTPATDLLSLAPGGNLSPAVSSFETPPLASPLASPLSSPLEAPQESYPPLSSLLRRMAASQRSSLLPSSTFVRIDLASGRASVMVSNKGDKSTGHPMGFRVVCEGEGVLKEEEVVEGRKDGEKRMGGSGTGNDIGVTTGGDVITMEEGLRCDWPIWLQVQPGSGVIPPGESATVEFTLRHSEGVAAAEQSKEGMKPGSGVGTPLHDTTGPSNGCVLVMGVTTWGPTALTLRTHRFGLVIPQFV
ncbi:unnamed protein product [Closterium sp. NIES-65]|nr:unnamed protein product [Closterium sp. NIES-65]